MEVPIFLHSLYKRIVSVWQVLKHSFIIIGTEMNQNKSPWFHGAAILAGAARQKANGHRQGQVVIRVMERSPAEERDIVTRLAILNWVVREGLIKW